MDNITINNANYKVVSPIMTFDNAPAPYVASCSINSINRFYCAFDRNPSKLFRTNISTTTPFTATLDYGEKNGTVVNAYRLDCSYNKNWSMNSWTFEGSKDNVTWIVLDTQTGITWDEPIQDFAFNNTESYRYYRFNVKKKNGTNSVCINEVYLLQEIVTNTRLYFKKILKANLPVEQKSGTDTLFFTETGEIYLTDKNGIVKQVGGSGNIEEYSEDEINEMFDVSSSQLNYYQSIINDEIVSTNKLWSSEGVNKKIYEAVQESNAYSDELLGSISSINLIYVTSLPETGNNNTIYILKATDGGNDTLNLYNNEWTTIGEFDISLENYYTKLEINTLLEDKANKDKVLSIDKVVQNLDTVDGTSVLSTAGFKNEIDKVIPNTVDYTDQIIKESSNIKSWYLTTALVKYGNFVSFNVNITVNSTTATTKYTCTLGIVPEACRPPQSRAFNGVTNNGIPCYFWLDADGRFGITLSDLSKSFDQGDGIRICITYII